MTVEVRSDERFQQEIGAFLPGAGALFSQQQQQEAEAALPTEEVAMVGGMAEHTLLGLMMLRVLGS